MPSEALLGAVLIGVTALLYSSVGHAGASGYLAVMGLLGTAPAVMRPTALVLNLIVATIGTFHFARAGHFKWSVFWPFAAGSVPMAFLGGRLSLPTTTYKVVIGIVLLLSAIRFLVTLRSADEVRRTVSWPAAMAVGAFLGFLSGLTGVGGGIFLSPILLFAGWATVKTTAATSVTFILVNSAAGLLGQFYTGKAVLPNVPPEWVAAVLIGGGIGSRMGSRYLPSTAIRGLLVVVLVWAGVKLVMG